MANMDLLEGTVRLIQAQMDSRLNSLAIEAVRVGIFFTGVKLSSGHAGVAFTPAGEIPEAVCCPKSAARMPDAGKLTGKTVDEVLAYALSPNVLKSAIGVAMVNALSHHLFEEGTEQDYEVHFGPDGLDFLDVTPDDRISLVGAFTPYIRRFKNQGIQFFIIEKTSDALKPDEMKYYRPSSEAAKILPESDVVIITGAAIVNHTLDGLLKQTRSNARVAVIGPTSSMVPDVYFRGGVDLMAGIRVTNPDLMLRILEEGGSGYHLFNTCAERVTFVKNRAR
ncbi:MAG: Fis family transcriptional regulator [Proteobacteria bacterium]|nr:Fis family transcriptional regulator [Pseudomonadota bacterium]